MRARDANGLIRGRLVMLSIPISTVAYIALSARARETLAQEIESSPEADEAEDVYADEQPLTIGAVELATAIERLNEDEKADLVALMWLGRGDFDAYQEARRMAEERQNGQTARYLLGEPLLAEHLEEALTILGYSPEDFTVEP
ncbi:MAG: DUF3775 domain-containing protein [Sandaracinaceae bacterium]|nr:DUF3775 domain-containing protein [Sandaracinaceae bacterium]